MYQLTTAVTEVRMVYNNKVKVADRPQVKCSQDAYEILQANWSDQIGLLEEFYILLLDRSSRVMGKYLVSQGGMAGTVVDAKIIFAAALKGRCSFLILSHNHPSGSLFPLQLDKDLIRKLIEGGKVLDIFILDHLILSPDGGYYSFGDGGFFN